MRTAEMIQRDIDAINEASAHLRISTREQIENLTSRLRNSPPAKPVFAVSGPTLSNSFIERFYQEPLSVTYPYDVTTEG